MTIYPVKKDQSEKNYVFLRIMIYFPYLLFLRKLQSRFPSNSEMFFYLVFKYRQSLVELTSLKSSSKKKYQEITCEYANIGIRVSYGVHQILKDLSDVTGYSISALVRFLIEWECLDEFSEGGRVQNLNYNYNYNSTEIVITEVIIHHQYDIINERVEENFIWGFS